MAAAQNPSWSRPADAGRRNGKQLQPQFLLLVRTCRRIATTHHCCEAPVQPLPHAADQRAGSEVAAEGQLLALHRRVGRRHGVDVSKGTTTVWAHRHATVLEHLIQAAADPAINGIHGIHQ